MKKCLLVLLAMCGASYGASDSSDRSENCTSCCDEKREAYAGAYVGAGLSYQHNKNDVTVSDNYADIAGASTYAESFATGVLRGMSEEEARESAETVAARARKDNPSADNWRLNGKKKGKIGGAINFGYGKFVNSYLYLGADFVLDIASKGKSSDVAEKRVDDFKSTTVENGGVVPTVALRVGGYIPAIDSLICARFGGAFVNTKSIGKVYGQDSEIKIRKIVPVVGLSFEKNLMKNWSVKLEGDCRFSTKKEKSIIVRTESGVEGRVLTKAKSNSYCVRLMGVYRFN